MEKVRKILVHLSKDNGVPQCVRFVQSITGHFARTLEDEAEVKCSLENNRFILFSGETGRIPLKGCQTLVLKGRSPDGFRCCPAPVHLIHQKGSLSSSVEVCWSRETSKTFRRAALEDWILAPRASFCPFKHLSITEAAAIPLDVLDRGVDVGVAVLLQSANKKVLLTRRASGLRIFPNVWVPPGGHVELDERLLDAGLRELREETGLKLEPGDVSSQLLGLWESVYPPMLSRGLPQRHHVVTYMLLQSSLTHQQLQSGLCPDPAEVSGCLWVDPSIVKAIVSAVDGEEDSDLPLEGLSPTISVSEVSPEGRLTESVLPLSTLCSRAPAVGPDVERVSTGTKYALELWLKTLET